MTTSQLTRPPSGASLKADVLEVLKVLETFSALLEKETEALKKANFKVVDTLQADKKSLAKQYHNLVTTLSARKADINTLDLTLRERLIKARTNFTITLNDNMRALEATKDSAKRLVDRILDAARSTVIDENQTTYSAKGKTGSYKSALNSLSFDQKL